MKIFEEIYQFLFFASILYILLTLSNLFMKLYGRFKLKSDIRFKQTPIEKALFIISIAIFFTYIIK